jgi:hypothetical protein
MPVRRITPTRWVKPKEDLRQPYRHNAIGCILFNTTLLGPPVWTQQPCTSLPWTMKGRTYASLKTQLKQHSHPDTSSPARTGLEQSLENTGNTSHSGRRVLRSGGPNHSKSLRVPLALTPNQAKPSGCPRVHIPSLHRRVHSATRLELSAAPTFGSPGRGLLELFDL